MPDNPDRLAIPQFSGEPSGAIKKNQYAAKRDPLVHALSQASASEK
jgi:hypothetical protein